MEYGGKMNKKKKYMLIIRSMASIDVPCSSCRYTLQPLSFTNPNPNPKHPTAY